MCSWQQKQQKAEISKNCVVESILSLFPGPQLLVKIYLIRSCHHRFYQHQSTSYERPYLPCISDSKWDLVLHFPTPSLSFYSPHKQSAAAAVHRSLFPIAWTYINIFCPYSNKCGWSLNKVLSNVIAESSSSSGRNGRKDIIGSVSYGMTQKLTFALYLDQSETKIQISGAIP